MVAKQAGQVAGGFAGGFLNNPGVVAVLGIAITVITSLLIFRKDIADFFGGLSVPQIPEINISLPEITFPELPSFPEITFPDFPEITFPDFPDINIFGGGDGDDFVPFSQETNAEDFPTEEPLPATCECGSTIVQDASGNVTQTCLACEVDTPTVPEEGDPEFIGPVQPDEPELELPPGFVGGGPSFEGGTIFDFEEPAPFEIGIGTTLNEIINALGVSATEAANLLFEATEFGTSSFSFGTNVDGGA